MYMRLIGYPANKITILTTYNGQKHLIRDVINTRCASNSLIGRPYKVNLKEFFFYLTVLSLISLRQYENELKMRIYLGKQFVDSMHCKYILTHANHTM